MDVWIYRNCKVVRVREVDVTHHGPVDDCFLSDIHEEDYDDYWWERPEWQERPPSSITLDMYVDPHTGNAFARGNYVVIEDNYLI